jgi:PAB-dependent poly(A)-specific ribonuclease subunit 2
VCTCRSSTVGGQLASYRCADLSRYSSVQVCYPDGSAASQLGLVRDFTTNSNLVFTATYKGLRTYTKGCLLKDDGRKIPSLQSPMRCVALNPFHPVQVFCANDNGQGMLVDSERFRIIRQENMGCAPDSCITTCSWTTQALFTGDSKGKLSMREPASFREMLSTCAFMGPIFDISTNDYQIAVAGMSSIHPQMIDTNVKVLDRRMLYPIETIFTGGIPLEIKLDSYGNTLGYSEHNKLLWILNNLGVLECFDLSECPAMLVHGIVYDETMNTFITSFDISEMGAIALADSIGMFHIWSCLETDRFCSIHASPNYPKEPTIPTPCGSLEENPSQQIDWTTIDTVAASSYSWKEQVNKEEKDWLGHCDEYADDCVVRCHIYRRVDPKLISTAQKIGKFSYIPIPSSYEQSDRSSYGWIEYISPNSSHRSTNQSEEFQDNPAFRCVYTPIDLVALQSLEGFDYSLYNKSPFCGLENGLPNAYVNPVIQSLYFLEEFREYVMPLDKIRVEEEYCLMDELALLFQMMKVGSGQACEASNFMRAFQKIPNTSALGLLDGPGALFIALRVESFIRYMLEQLSRDEESFRSSSSWLQSDSKTTFSSIVDTFFGNRVLETFEFATNSFSQSEKRQFLWSLQYDDTSRNAYEELMKDFPKRLETCFCEETRNIRAYNEASRIFESCTRCKYLVEPSNVLLIGCNFSDEEHYLDYWFRYCGENIQGSKGNDHQEEESFRTQAAHTAYKGGQDIPLELFLEKTMNNDTCLPSWKVKTSSYGDSDWTTLEKIYDLHFVIAFVPHQPVFNYPNKAWNDLTPPGHLVVYVRNSDESTSDSVWWCINDFCITRCQSAWEVTRFHPNWKLPCVLGYKVRNASRRIPKLEAQHYSLQDIYERACNVVINSVPNHSSSYLFPSKGSYIALDAEFVEISKEVAEIHGDGTCKILKPSQMSLGRVSVVTSDDNHFVVLMDDYIVQRVSESYGDIFMYRY